MQQPEGKQLAAWTWKTWSDYCRSTCYLPKARDCHSKLKEEIKVMRAAGYGRPVIAVRGGQQVRVWFPVQEKMRGSKK